MKKLLLTMRVMLLVAVACVLAMPARADVTVYVLTKSGAPCVHAWTSSRDLTSWPGEQLTTIENINGVYYWKKVFSGVNEINMIFTNGGNGDDTKTNNIEGVTGTVYYQYDNYETAFGIIPPEVKYIGSNVVAYYASASQSENVTAQVRVPGSSTDWTAVTAMEKVGVDGAGHKIFRINFGPQSNFGFWGNIANAEILFWVDGQQVGTYAYKNYGYYSPYHRTGKHSLIIDGWLLNTTHYNNTTLVNALKERAADYYDSSTNLITTSTALSLDLSGKSIGTIQNLTDFSNLRNLNISNNNISPSNFAKIKTMSLLQTLKAGSNYPITYGDLSQMTQLRHLDMSGNSGLKGFGINSGSSSNPILNIANGVPLQYVNLSNCNSADAKFFLAALKDRGSAVLDTLILAGNSKMGWKSDIEGLTHLTYLDMSNCGLSSTESGTAPNWTNLTNLETLILANNKSGTSKLNQSNISMLSKLKYFDISGSDLYLRVESANGTKRMLYYMTPTNNPLLETLNISNSNIGTAETLVGFQNLKRIDASGNSGMTTFGVSNCPNLEEIDFTNCGSLNTLTFTNNNYSTVADMPTFTGLSANNATLDMSDNLFSTVPSISGINVNTLLLNNNRLTSISGLAGTGVKNLSVQNNPFSGHYIYNGARLYPVETIDFSNNSGLTGLSILNECAADATATATGARSSLQTVSVAGCPSLTTLAITGADLYAKNEFATFDATNKTTLQRINFSNNNITHYYNDLVNSGFTALQEIDLSSNPLTSIYSTSSSSSVLSPRNLVINGVPNLATVKLNSTPVQVLTITGSPLLETVNVTGETGLTTIDLSSNGLTSSHVPTITGWTTADAVLKYNDNGFSAIPSAPSNVSYLYLLRNEFASDLTLDGSSVTYKGVALSNKSTASPITSLTTSGSNSTLEALNLDGNTGLKTLKVNHFTGLTQTASNADMTTAAGKGLYIKGLSALETIDISHNAFAKFGQDGSTTGLSAVKTLDASHNALYTFSNKTAIPAKYYNGNVVSNARAANPTFSTLEDLTALETLKLNDNQLCDSVHLWKNKNLRYLDVSNNRSITQRAVGDYRVYRKGDGTTANWAKMVADRYTGDLNDTLGLRMLDLFWNQKLEYINISNTAIQNTAMDHYFMCNFDNPGTSDANAHPEKVPHYILVNRCKELLEFRADNNGMKSLGVGSAPRTTCYNSRGSGNAEVGTHTYTENGVSGVEWVTGCPKLEIVSVKGARGQDPNIMMGELNVSARTPNVWYYDVSDGGFDYIGTANGANLKYLNVSGNYNSTNQYTYNSSDKKWHCTVNGEDYTTGGNPFQLNVNVNSKLETLVAQDCPKLQVIVAEHLDNLTAVDLTQHAASDINQVYIDHNSSLPGVTGLETLTELHTLWVNDDPAMAGLDVTANTKLERLHAQNNPQFGVTDTKLTLPATSSYLKTLWVSNDNLGDLNSDKDLNVSGYAALDSLLCDNNRLLYLSKGDNLATNTALRHLNCDNNLIADLSLAGATQLEKVNANDNDLFKLDVSGNHPNLVELKFANNHVNGIALAGATSLTQANYDDTNNGRQITANHQRFYTDKPNQGGVEKDLYYFQLVNGDEGTYGKWVSNETSTDSENHENVTRVLGVDGFDASKWASATVSRPNQVAATADDVNANKVYGTIAVLTPTSESSTQASGRANYEYNNGNSAITSNFYLDWTANPTVFTGIDDVPATGGGVVVAGQGALIVNGATAGQVLGIYDLQGREVRHVTLVEGRNEISLPAGIYIVNGQKVMIR